MSRPHEIVHWHVAGYGQGETYYVNVKSGNSGRPYLVVYTPRNGHARCSCLAGYHRNHDVLPCSHAEAALQHLAPRLGRQAAPAEPSAPPSPSAFPAAPSTSDEERAFGRIDRARRAGY